MQFLKDGLVGRAERGAEQGDIAADQRAGSDAAAQDGDGLLLVAVANAARSGRLHQRFEEALQGEVGQVSS